MAAPASWSSPFGFLMASIGFAVGLGNIWRFPYVTGENGGSAFVLVYLVCAFAIGVPILMAELMLGRRGAGTPPAALRQVGQLAGVTSHWRHVGHLNLLTAFGILIGYGVVAGWVLLYLYRALLGDLPTDGPQSSHVFDHLLTNIPLLAGWTLMSFLLAGAIIYAGVQKGIERAVVLLMPLLFVLLICLVGYNLYAGGMNQALGYLFYPDFSKLTPATCLAAVGQAFFSIGVAMAGMMMFGAYLPKQISIAKCAIIIVLADTAVALLAGLVIFPMVFHNQLSPDGGAGLIFQTLPVAFAQMPAGRWVGVVFFLLLSTAAITSVVGLAEPLCAWCSERFGWSRRHAAGVLVVVLFSFSLISILSYNVWVDVSVAGVSLARLIDVIPNQVLLPVGGLLIALFAAWRVPAALSREELNLANNRWFHTWQLLLRWIAVPAVLVILIAGMFG